ncbi:MAG: hypothetical protein ACI9XO_000682 [Paraglaciecola sp.]|jgi:hypothetical protein
MNHSELLEITLEADLDSLKNSRRTNAKQKAWLTFKDKKNQVHKWKIKVQTRGKSRRQICEMPPLRFFFKKSKLAKKGLKKFNDMKLVTHCLADKKDAKRLLMKEYLIYQLYNELTENSYRTQLVSIIYKDKKTGREEQNWGFLIEDMAELAARLNAERVEILGSSDQDFEEGMPEIVALFQYMVGNKDYKVEALRNVKTLRRDDKLILVSYDFDYSGLVNAPYAKPNPNYKLKRVTDRAYLGSAESLSKLDETKKIFLEKKKRFIEIIEDFPELDKKTKQKVIKYLEKFYKNIDDIELATRKVPKIIIREE